MDKNRFKDLLTDLYTKYNKPHLVYVDKLVQENYESPFVLVDSIFMKYNHKSMSHYDPTKAGEQYRIQLLKDYEAGKRTFRDIDLIKEAEERRLAEQGQQESPEKVVEKMTDDKIGQATKSILENVSEEISKATSKAVEDFKKTMDDGVDYTITMDDVGEDVILPNKRHLAALGINARLFVKSVSGKLVGFTVKDISYDSFSLGDKVSVTIHLEKG